MSGSPGWSPPAPHHRTRDDVPFSRRAGAARLSDRGPLWGASPLPRLDGVADREAAALRVGRLDLLARRVEVIEAATEVNGRLAWGLPRPTSAALCHSPVSWPSSSAPTSPTGASPWRLAVAMPGGGPLRASKWVSNPSVRRWQQLGWVTATCTLATSTRSPSGSTGRRPPRPPNCGPRAPPAVVRLSKRPGQ
jgi:hypothetical protein